MAESSQAATNPTCGCISGHVWGRSFPRPVAHRDRPPAPAPRGDRAEPSASSPRPQAPCPCLPMLQGKVSGTWIPGPSRHPLRFQDRISLLHLFLEPGMASSFSLFPGSQVPPMSLSHPSSSSDLRGCAVLPAPASSCLLPPHTSL